jgi:hypothetical protein
MPFPRLTDNAADAADAAVIEQLRALGIDMRQPVVVEFGPSLLPSEQAATEAADILGAQDYDVLIGRPADGSAWRHVVVEHGVVLDLPTLRQHQQVIHDVVERAGGQFDTDWRARLPD